MSLRVDIQKKLIELFRAGTFYPVTYDVSGIPTASSEKLAPSTVLCNESSASIAAKADGQGLGYQFAGWSFTVYLNFTKEIDYSEFVLNELKDVIVNSGVVMATASIGGSVIVKHPPRQGAETGTELQFNISIKTRR